MAGAIQKVATSPESGYSESSNTTLVAENESLSSITAPTLQNYLQTWTPEETPEMANLVTITVNGITINGYFKNGDVIKLMTAFNVDTTTLSTSHPVDDENRLTSDLCHSWVQSHHSETTAKEDCTPAAAAFEFKEGDSSFGQVSSTTALRVGADQTMAVKLQPKLACTARETSHAPFGLSEASMCGAEAVSGLPPDAEDSSLSSEEDPDVVPVVTKWMLEEDLRVSSDDDDADNGPEQPPQAPMTDAIILDGLKLRINKRKIKEAAVAPEPKKKPRSRWSSSDSSSAESMEDEDLPLYDDALLSNDSCSSFEDANEENMISESKREPRALDKQGTMVPKETKYKLDMEVWYEQRRQEYAKFIPDAAKKMVTNMQPIVWLERDPYIDRIALDLLRLESGEICEGQSDNDSLHLQYESSEDDISLSFNSDGNVDFPNLSSFSSTQDGDDIVLRTSDDIQTPQQEQETAADCETACKNVNEVVANDLHDAIDKILAEQPLQPDDSVWQLYQTYHDNFEVENSSCDQSPENFQLLLNDSDIPESQVQATLPQADEPMAKPAENLQLDLIETQNEFPNHFSPGAEKAPISVEPLPVPCEVELPASIQEASPEKSEGSSEEGNSQAESDEDCIHLDVSDDEFV